MNAIYNKMTTLVMTPNVSVQTALYSMPVVSLVVRIFQRCNCFNAIEKNGTLSVEKFREQQSKFQKGLSNGLKIQIAGTVMAFVLGLFFPVPSTGIWICAQTTSLFFAGATSLFTLNSILKIPTFQIRRTECNGTEYIGG